MSLIKTMGERKDLKAGGRQKYPQDIQEEPLILSLPFPPVVQAPAFGQGGRSLCGCEILLW